MADYSAFYSRAIFSFSSASILASMTSSFFLSFSFIAYLSYSILFRRSFYRITSLIYLGSREDELELFLITSSISYCVGLDDM